MYANVLRTNGIIVNELILKISILSDAFSWGVVA